MNRNSEKDMKCPICDKSIRSDATINKFCKLCGMGIPEPSKVPKLQTNNGTAYFCCYRCLSIYKKNIA